jgi:hypothetical protein
VPGLVSASKTCTAMATRLGLSGLARMGEHGDLTLWTLVHVMPSVAGKLSPLGPVQSPAILPYGPGVVGFQDQVGAAIRCQRPPARKSHSKSQRGPA